MLYCSISAVILVWRSRKQTGLPLMHNSISPAHRAVQLAACFVLLPALALCADPTPATQPTAPRNWTAAQDQQNMLEQLGIKSLRPAPSGRAGAPNAANYDEEKANPYPDPPAPPTLKSGQKVPTAEMWWKQRRPE